MKRPILYGILVGIAAPCLAIPLAGLVAWLLVTHFGPLRPLEIIVGSLVLGALAAAMLGVLWVADRKAKP